jgi:hypothetical protein
MMAPITANQPLRPDGKGEGGGENNDVWHMNVPYTCILVHLIAIALLAYRSISILGATKFTLN